MALVSIRNLTRIFDVSKPWLNRVIERRPRALLTAVSDVSFEIEERTVYALVGESGSGKSTIGKMLVGLMIRLRPLTRVGACVTSLLSLWRRVAVRPLGWPSGCWSRLV